MSSSLYDLNVVQIEIFFFFCSSTAVRFFDHTKELARLALRFEKINEQRKLLLRESARQSMLWKSILNITALLLFIESRILNEHAQGRAIALLRLSIENAYNLALERLDGRFVDAMDDEDELYEVSDLARRSVRIQIHVFDSPDLLIDKFSPVASIV